MKRALTIPAIFLLAGIFLYACGIIPNSDTSVVTITIGDDPQKAVLKAEAATPWTRMKHFLADLDLVPEANAYIPSVVQVIIVTVTAGDITTPIVGVKSVKDTDTSASIRIEVPNGSARTFLVEGYRGADSQVYYRGTATADLSGTDVTLPVAMTLVGPGKYVDFATGVDSIATSGSLTDPYKTITYALTQASVSSAIFVKAGTYPPAGASAGEVYPIQLKPDSPIVCLGTGFSSVLDLSSTFGSTAIYGAEGAAVDNCRIVVGQNGKGIDDRQGGTTPLVSGLRINGLQIDMPMNLTPVPMIGIDLFSDSPVLETTIAGGAGPFSGTEIGVQVNGGKPSIIGSSISGLATGVRIGSGDPLVRSTLITNNSEGISIVASAKGQIEGNTIHTNTIGVNLQLSTGGDPRINGNDIFCNTAWGVEVSALTPIRLEDNAWNRDATTAVPGPIINNSGNCLSGDDVCVRAVDPIYIPFRPAVLNGCP